MEQIWQFRDTGQYGSFRSGGGAGLRFGDRLAAPSMPQSTSTSDTSRIPTIFPRTTLAARLLPLATCRTTGRLAGVLALAAPLSVALCVGRILSFLSDQDFLLSHCAHSILASLSLSFGEMQEG